MEIVKSYKKSFNTFILLLDITTAPSSCLIAESICTVIGPRSPPMTSVIWTETFGLDSETEGWEAKVKATGMWKSLVDSVWSADNKAQAPLTCWTFFLKWYVNKERYLKNAFTLLLFYQVSGLVLSMHLNNDTHLDKK